MTPLIAMPATAPTTLDPAAVATADGAQLPALPVLSAMLRVARRLPAAADWRSGVLAASGLAAAAGAAPAAIAARAVASLAAGAAVCFVAPVHAIAGISRVFLAPGERIGLELPERERLRHAFNAEFGAADVQLHAVGTGWLLQAPFAAAADDASPELLIGAALARDPARSAAARLLRRLGAEVEMWLAALPLNREREARGAPPINSFWFSGGTQVVELATPRPRPAAIFSNDAPDAWLAGLASHCGLSACLRMASWSDAARQPGTLVVLQPPELADPLALMSAWEAHWLEPAFADLAARRLPALRLQIGRSAWQLPAPRLTRWLRRARPWWQQLQP